VSWGRRNPKKSDIYDPRMEQVRAQRQAVYEAEVRRTAGRSYNEPFRDESGRRLDATSGLWRTAQGTAAAKKMFSVGTAVPQRYGRLYGGSQEPTAQAAAESYERYQHPDHLLRNRQDYEETLALYRKNFYRAIPEHTRVGVRYTVWPMQPGQRAPRVFNKPNEATGWAKLLNEAADPRVEGDWWAPPSRPYTRKELYAWLPPDTAFGFEKSPKAKKRGQKVEALRPTRTQRVPKKAREVARQVASLENYFHASGGELKRAAAAGDSQAQRELSRRKAKRRAHR